MQNEFAKFGKAVWRFATRQDGQDLVEYALIVALISLGATAAMQSVASDISAAFSNNASTFNSDI